jgi:hypothetical protein
MTTFNLNRSTKIAISTLTAVTLVLAVSLLSIFRRPAILLNQWGLTTDSPTSIHHGPDCLVGVQLENVGTKTGHFILESLKACLNPSLRNGRLSLIAIQASTADIKLSQDDFGTSSVPQLNNVTRRVYEAIRNLMFINADVNLQNVYISLTQDLKVKIKQLQLSSQGRNDTNLSATLAVNESQDITLSITASKAAHSKLMGTLAVSGENLSVKVPASFIHESYLKSNQPTVDSIDMRAEAELSPESLLIKISKFDVDSGYVKASGTSELVLNQSEFNYTVAAKAQNANKNVIGIIPESVMGSETYSWIAANIHHATCAYSTVNLAADTTSLTHLSIDLECQDTSLGMSAEWPELTAKNMHVNITKSSVSVSAPEANIGNLNVHDVVVRVPEFKNASPRLVVNAAISQNLIEILPALTLTPLSSITGIFEKTPWDISGLLTGNLDMTIPLTPQEKKRIAFNGKVQNGSLRSKSGVTPSAEDVKVDFAYVNDRLEVSDIAGKISWSLGVNHSADLKIAGRGHATFVTSSHQNYLFDFNVIPQSVSIDSDALNQFIGNTLDSGNVRISGDQDDFNLFATLNNNVHTALKWKLETGRWGAVTFGDKPQIVAIDTVVFDMPWAIGEIDLSNQDQYVARFQTITFPDLIATLNTPESSTTPVIVDKNIVPSFDPRSIPGMDVIIKNVKLGWRELGSARIKTTKVSKGLRLDQLSIEQGPCSHFNSTGHWLVSEKTPQASHLDVKGNLYCRDVGRSFRMLKAPSVVNGFQGQLAYRLTWENPSSSTFDNLNVTTNGEFTGGRILMAKSGLLKAVEVITLNIRDNDKQGVYINKIQFNSKQIGYLSRLEKVNITTPSYNLHLTGNYHTGTKKIKAAVDLKLKLSGLIGKSAMVAVNPLYAKDVLSADNPMEIEKLDNMTKYSFNYEQDLSNQTSQAAAATGIN